MGRAYELRVDRLQCVLLTTSATTETATMVVRLFVASREVFVASRRNYEITASSCPISLLWVNDISLLMPVLPTNGAQQLMTTCGHGPHT